jgi:hypothetical protein
MGQEFEFRRVVLNQSMDDSSCDLVAEMSIPRQIVFLSIKSESAFFLQHLPRKISVKDGGGHTIPHFETIEMRFSKQ